MSKIIMLYPERSVLDLLFRMHSKRCNKYKSEKKKVSFLADLVLQPVHIVMSVLTRTSQHISEFSDIIHRENVSN